jgi:unsaturated rhamnogalacturonyl hydrolase
MIWLLVLCLIAPAAARAADRLDRWRAVADRLIGTPPETFPFNWGEGVQAIGLMKVSERTRDPGYADYVEKWSAVYLPRGLDQLLNIGPKARGARPGYCGYWSPATAILYLHQARGNPEHLRFAEQVAAFIRNGAERGPEGGLGHWQGSHQLWVDTLYMACPLLAGLRKPEYIHDAVNQILVYARHLQDPKSGLFFHMWDWQTGQHSPDLWGRGNGWVLMSLADTLEAMDRKHPLYQPLRTVALRQARGLQATQDRDGLWHTVLDDRSSYAESSATSMVAYGLFKLVRLGVLPKSYRALAQRAWSAVTERYIQDGIVVGVSAGTSPSGGDHYRSRPQGTQSWGTGAYLMAGSEIHRLAR